MGAKIDKAKGRAKQALGVLTDSEKLKQSGEKDELKGKVKGAADEVANVVTKVKRKLRSGPDR